jgi:hypothetical protein
MSSGVWSRAFVTSTPRAAASRIRSRLILSQHAGPIRLMLRARAERPGTAFSDPKPQNQR